MEDSKRGDYNLTFLSSGDIKNLFRVKRQDSSHVRDRKGWLKMVAFAASHLPVRFNWVDVENEDGRGKDDERCVRTVEEKVVYSTETWNHDNQDED